MKKNVNRTLGAFIILLLMAGCAVTDFDKSVNFTQYGSYAWTAPEVDVKNPVYDSELIDKNIKTIVAEEFSKRGIVMDTDNPDFFISYKTYTEQKQKHVNASPYGVTPFFPYGFSAFRFGWWGWGMPYGYYNVPRTETVTEGTLIVDITDARTKELIWRGTVSGDVGEVKNLQRQIEKGVKAILKKYPITPKEPLLPDDKKIIS